MASLIEGFRPYEHFYEMRFPVMVVNGDDALASIGVEAIAILKIDVEGGELEVMRGLQSTVKRCRPAVLCEVLPVIEGRPEVDSEELRAFRRTRQNELMDIFRRLDYVVYRNHQGESFEKVCDFGEHADLSKCEYLCLPREREDLHRELRLDERAASEQAAIA